MSECKKTELSQDVNAITFLKFIQAENFQGHERKLVFVDF